MDKCLQCKLPETSCKCPGGFKIIYWCGKPVSRDEADSISHELQPGMLEKRFKDVENALRNLSKK